MCEQLSHTKRPGIGNSQHQNPTQENTDRLHHPVPNFAFPLDEVRVHEINAVVTRLQYNHLNQKMEVKQNEGNESKRIITVSLHNKGLN